MQRLGKKEERERKERTDRDLWVSPGKKYLNKILDERKKHYWWILLINPKTLIGVHDALRQRRIFSLARGLVAIFLTSSSSARETVTVVRVSQHWRNMESAYKHNSFASNFPNVCVCRCVGCLRRCCTVAEQLGFGHKSLERGLFFFRIFHPDKLSVGSSLKNSRVNPKNRSSTTGLLSFPVSKFGPDN